MYTQCPECNLSFRISADVLKQAAGKVRCGGCGTTFNALEYLSEGRPGEQRGLAATGAPPELEAEPLDDPDVAPPPTAVSPEQSRELLESLKELADSDVRLEDTGVEWRILSGSDDNPAADVDATSREMRFDDNTGLPDDFDHDAPPAPSAPRSEPEPEPEPELELDHGDTHIDIAFGNPEEWGALLSELTGEAEPDAAPASGDPEAGGDFEDELAEMDVLLADAGPGAADEIALELEETRRDLKDSTIEEDLLAAAFESERRGPDTSGGEATAKDEETVLTADQDDAQSAALGDDLKVDLDFDDSIALDLDALSEEDERVALAFKAANEDGSGDATKKDAPAEAEPVGELEELDEPVEVIDDAPTGHHEVPEQSEEEETINRMIDEQLLSVAGEDEDGFASTIVIDDDAPETPVADTAFDVPAELLDGDGGETIVMEGESIGDGSETDSGVDADADPEITALRESLKEQAAAEEAAGGEWLDERRTRMAVAALALLLVLQGLHFSRAALATMPGIGGAIKPVYAAIGMPITPEWDVTGWKIEVGQATGVANTDASTEARQTETLTIVSRVRNVSSEALPHPLLSVSLTDRFMEPIGNRVLEPADYLPEDALPPTFVPPGEAFNAIVSVESSAPEADGFQLTVCYRQADSRMRCAIGSFK